MASRMVGGGKRAAQFGNYPLSDLMRIKIPHNLGDFYDWADFPSLSS
jgi:hypothetical protein